jgi:hypothetical protein
MLAHAFPALHRLTTTSDANWNDASGGELNHLRRFWAQPS